MLIFRRGRPANGGFLRFRCSRTLGTLRSGSRKPPLSARPDLNLNTPRRMASNQRFRKDHCEFKKSVANQTRGQAISTQTGRWSEPTSCRSTHRAFGDLASEALVKT
ncbi:MAG: hypothetical protein EOR05_27890 [Mesorhizobium sp.]|nr:MAG: hypothetical protein EOR05_27890 [Mesorhizobium sp.]